MTVPSNIQTPVRRTQFGSGGTSATGLGGITGVVAKAFQTLEKDRGRQMIVEDFIGFGLLRTGVDLYRGKAYGNDSWNVPAAMERLFRETTSILTDNLLGGVVAAAIGLWLDRRNQAFSNAFTDYPTLELFQHITQNNLGGNLSSKQAEKAFLDALLKRFETVENKEQCRQALKAAWRQGAQEATKAAPAAASVSNKIANWLPGWFKQATNKPSAVSPKSYAELAADLARGISAKQNTFDLALKVKDASQVFKLDSLLEDVSRFSRQMHTLVEKEAQQSGKTQWQALASNTLKKTLTAKNWKLPIGMLAGMSATFAMPFLSAALTRKVYGIKYYPGEIGLTQNLTQNEDKPESPNAQNNASPSFIEKHFPYLRESHKNGNYLPLALTLIPIPFAFLFNTNTMRFINPFKQGAQKTLRNMFDFCKAKPFTAPQQMASMFALLITSRLLCARSDNEFRERLVDSFAGWGVWILGTPIIKKLAATLSDKYQGTQLLKDAADGSKTQLLRTQPEIKQLLKNSLINGKRVSADVATKTLKANVLMGAISTVASVALLGLVEPWLAMKWTQQNERNKQAKRAAANITPSTSSASLLQRRPFYLQTQQAQPTQAFPVASPPNSPSFQPQTNAPINNPAQTEAAPSVYPPVFYAPPSPFAPSPASPFLYQSMTPGQAGQTWGVPGWSNPIPPNASSINRLIQ